MTMSIIILNNNYNELQLLCCNHYAYRVIIIINMDLVVIVQTFSFNDYASDKLHRMNVNSIILSNVYLTY